MATDEGLHLSTEQLAQWKDRKTELESQIARIQQELATINRRLEAVAILSEPPDSEGMPVEDDMPLLQPRESMMYAVDRLVSQAGGLVSKRQIRRALANEGYPQSRLGSYFYTVIARLKERERIVVAPDGRVSAGPKAFVGSTGSAE